MNWLVFKRLILTLLRMESTLPAGPRSSLPLGLELAWRRGAPEFLRKAAVEFGPICGFNLKGRDIYFVSEPELIREVLVTKDKSFIKGPGFQRLKPWLGNGIITSEGAVHQRQRRMLQPAFHRKRIETYAEMMRDIAQKSVESLQADQALELLVFVERLTFQIASRAVFDADLDAKIKPLFGGIQQALRYLDTLNAYSIPALLRRWTGKAEREKAESIRVLHTIVDEIISSRRKDTAAERNDVLSMLVTALDEEGDGKGLSDDEVRDQVLSFLVGSFDSVSSAITSCFYLLSRNPQAEAEVLAELQQVLGGRIAGLADFPNLPKTYAAFSETLRLYPPAWILPRSAIEPVTIGGVDIPANGTVLVCSYATQRNPRFFPEPDKFDLSRWTPEAKAALPKFAYFPFGSGSRVCIGEQFAWMKAIILLSAFLPRWRFEPDFSGSLKYQSILSLRPKHDCPVHVRKR